MHLQWLMYNQHQFYVFQLDSGNAFLEIYDGGSNKDTFYLLLSKTGNGTSDVVYSSGNQIFVSFFSNRTSFSRGFTALIKFGTIILLS